MNNKRLLAVCSQILKPLLLMVFVSFASSSFALPLGKIPVKTDIATSDDLSSATNTLKKELVLSTKSYTDMATNVEDSVIKDYLTTEIANATNGIRTVESDPVAVPMIQAHMANMANPHGVTAAEVGAVTNPWYPNLDIAYGHEAGMLGLRFQENKIYPFHIYNLSLLGTNIENHVTGIGCVVPEGAYNGDSLARTSEVSTVFNDLVYMANAVNDLNEYLYDYLVKTKELHGDSATNVVWKNVYSNGWVFLVAYTNDISILNPHFGIIRFPHY